MKKLLWFIASLMTMVMFSSCGGNELDKFNLETSNLNKKSDTEWKMVENSLKTFENYLYLYGKGDLELITYLKTKIHIQTDSLILAESYIRGKNSFNSETMQRIVFIYLKNENGTYFASIDNDDIVNLIMRVGLENERRERNKVLSSYVIKYGYLNGETDYELIVRHNEICKEPGKSAEEIKLAKSFLDDELGI